ncbi:unnamed protein product [Alopecurus aequalis]
MLREGDACVALLRSKFHGLIERNHTLEEENKQLRHEVSHLKAQVSSLEGQHTDRKMIWKKLENSATNNNYSMEKQFVHNNVKEAMDLNISTYYSRQQFSRTPLVKSRAPRVPNPPPSPTCIQPIIKAKREGSMAPPPPPPPPPPPSKLLKSTKAVQRVPEVVELYRLLVKREGKNEGKSGSTGIPVAANSRDMIGEIENKSAYVIAIKSDVENQGELINFLAREVQNAAYKDIADVEEFVKWLDGELSYLVDERAVLKHFPNWPEKNADAMREAAFTYRDLKNLELEASSFHDDRRVATPMAFKRMQDLQDKIEQGIHNTEKIRDNASGRYKDLMIPWDWMLDAGIIRQLKVASLKLAREYMNRIMNALKSDPFANDEELILRGVRFSFRIHQLAGGFDEGCRKAFQELKTYASKAE